MAIQFNCPSCAATLKVPDAAAGKKGTCPKCGTALLVPRIEPPPSQAAASAAQGRSDEAAASSAPSDPAFREFPAAKPSPASEAEDPLAFLAHVEPTAPGTIPRESPTVRRLNRRRRGPWSLLIPLFFFAAFAGVGGWLYFREATPRLEGTLQAVALDEEQPPPGFITHLDADLPEDVFAQILKDLAAKPLPPVRSNLMEVEFKPGPKALEVYLRATPETQFFRVDLNRHPALRRFRNDRAKELGEPRREEFTAAAAQMLRDWQQSGSIDASRYRDTAGLNALLLPLSYHLQAVVDGNIYRAVAEDVDGRAYFLLPPGTMQFHVEGRKLKDGRVLFPGKYTVNVVPGEPAKAESEATGPAEQERPSTKPAADQVRSAEPAETPPAQ
jgi:hypothetical protein